VDFIDPASVCRIALQQQTAPWNGLWSLWAANLLYIYIWPTYGAPTFTPKIPKNSHINQRKIRKKNYPPLPLSKIRLKYPST
jgi:hypothetical protein